MGGKSSSPKQKVADYLLSIHFGVCHLADSIERIRVNDKTIFSGRADTNRTISIDLPNLFGGQKKEGGCRGLVEVLLGGASQILPARLAAKLGAEPENLPGFRGITSLFFTGGGSEYAAGFQWTSNTAYLRPVDVTVRRAPKGFYPQKAMVPDTPGSYDSIARIQESNDGPSWGGTWPRVKDAGSWGFVLEGANLERTYDNTGAYISTGGATFQPNPPINLTPIPEGFVLTGWLSEDPVVCRQTYASMNSSVSLAIGRFNALGQAGVAVDLTKNLPGEDKLVGALVCTSASVIMAFTQSLSVPAGGTGPANWHRLDSKGNILAQGYAGDEFDSNIFGFGDSGAIGYRASSLEPDLRTIWTSDGAGSHTTSWYYIDDYGNLKPGARLDFSTPEGFRRPSIRAFDGGAYLASGDYRAVFQRKSQVYDHGNANPAHIIYECLTNNDWGLGLHPEQIDTASFISAADTLFDEALGLSLLWSSATDMEAFLGQILSHIDGNCGVDPASGKIYLSLVRGGYSLDGLLELNEDNCVITRFQRKALSETYNEVVVTWTNPENEQEETVTVHDLANYAAQGILKSSASNYYGVRSAALALRLAMRDLTRGAAPLASFEVEANRVAWDKKPGDVVKISYPEYGIQALPVRVLVIDYGKPGSSKVKLSLVEDVFETPDSAYVEVPLPPIPDQVLPPNPLKFIQTGSVPYYLLSAELGSDEASSLAASEAYSLVLGAPNGAIQSIEMYVPVVDAIGQLNYQYQNTLEVPGRATLSTALVPEIVSTAVGFSGLIGNGGPTAGSLVWIGTTPSSSELCIVQSSEGPLTLRRGVLDTTPKTWAAGTPMWFITPGQELYDPTIRLVGQTSSYKLLPVNQVGVFREDWASPVAVTPDDRQHRPYRPANVTINGVYWPEVSEAPLVISWSRRNRLMEEPIVRLWNADDVAPEEGTTYAVTLTREDTGEVLETVSGLTGTVATLTNPYRGKVRLVVKANRLGMDSYQNFDHTFSTGEPVARVTEDGENRLTEDGENRVLES